MIKENIDMVREKIREAAHRAGRSEKDITLIAVTKNHEVEMLQEAVSNGIADIGENRVQELMSKLDKIPDNVNIHMIGQLQTNKVKYIIRDVNLIHSLDRLSLLKTLDKEAAKNGLVVNTLIQINQTDDPARGGISYADLPHFISKLPDYPNVFVRGLMCVAENTDDINKLRKDFSQMKVVFDSLNGYKIDNLSSDILSMGMSHDFEIAIEEGATHIRVGTMIFGRR